jgi:hypothetical protein
MLNLTYTIDPATESLSYSVEGSDDVAVVATPLEADNFWADLLSDDGDDVPQPYEVVCGYTGIIYLAQTREQADHLAWALAIAYNANQHGVGIATKTVITA